MMMRGRCGAPSSTPSSELTPPEESPGGASGGGGGEANPADTLPLSSAGKSPARREPRAAGDNASSSHNRTCAEGSAMSHGSALAGTEAPSF